MGGVTADRQDAADTGRWASEGGADPRGPATDSPVAPPAQTDEPPEGSSVPRGEPAPEEIGESGWEEK